MLHSYSIFFLIDWCHIVSAQWRTNVETGWPWGNDADHRHFHTAFSRCHFLSSHHGSRDIHNQEKTTWIPTSKDRRFKFVRIGWRCQHWLAIDDHWWHSSLKMNIVNFSLMLPIIELTLLIIHFQIFLCTSKDTIKWKIRQTLSTFRSLHFDEIFFEKK